MSIVSAAFVIFITVVFLLYFIVPKRWQWKVLLIASYCFYSFSDFRYIVFLLLTTMSTYVLARYLERIAIEGKAYIKENKSTLSKEERKEYKDTIKKRKQKTVLIAVVFNLLILIVLKYGNFILLNSVSVLKLLWPTLKVYRLNLFVPLGISFYTLQAIGYVVDVYKEQIEADKNFFQYALFLSYFPQIIQGPISRHNQLAHQLYESHSIDYDRMTKGIQLIIWGFIKKLVIADRIGIIVDEIFKHWTVYSGAYLFFGVAAFGMQLYCDFSGGMDIARGVSQVLGIELTLNFRRPYFSCSLEEFWRRWHITLGAFMREYIFYPVSLSKASGRLGKKARNIFGNYIGKKLPTFLAMFLVFILVGIWHGPQWKYIGYGLYNGAIIVSSILLEPIYESVAARLHIDRESKGWRLFRMVRTFAICSMGRFFSRAKSFKIAIKMMLATVLHFNMPSQTLSLTELGIVREDVIMLIVMLCILLIVGILQEKEIRIRDSIASKNIVFRWTIYIGAILLVALYGMYGPGNSGEGFIYEQF
ncbi:MBOAT family O-acyltransferase [Anaerosporobacter sp.]|uniref:MBOAT family O-acyltransferase n=1 Tax=Anaerosporobacter sp. TaxID=1872529 RepID=UPI00286ED312|nr:MBOAT family O-acyltransferase [Anaerosporobacter sp.]